MRPVLMEIDGHDGVLSCPSIHWAKQAYQFFNAFLRASGLPATARLSRNGEQLAVLRLGEKGGIEVTK